MAGKKPIVTNIDLFNALRNNKNSTFYNRIPKATQENMADIAKKIEDYKPMFEELTGEIVSKIGLQILATNSNFEDPLKIFEKGELPFGKTIEEIYIGLYPAREFNSLESETDVLKRVKADIKTLYHSVNSELFYKTTVDWQSLKRGIIDGGTGMYDAIGNAMISRLFDSDELDRYQLKRQLLNDGVKEAVNKDSKVRRIEIEYSDDDRFSKALAKVMRSTAKQLSFWNASTIAGVDNVTRVDKQVIITTPEVEAMMDVDVLSSAFHMDKANTQGRLAVIDQFENENVLAIICSEDWMIQYDTYRNLEPDLYNPQGLYRQYWLHDHAIYSYSKFENFIVIMKTPDKPEA